jgi:hypothetical protein
MRTVALWLLVGCGSPGLSGPDASTPDLAGAADLSAPDLAEPPLPPCSDRDGGVERQFAVDQVVVPSTNPEEFGIDLNGDGKIDNRMGHIMISFSLNSIPVQPPLDSAITSGSDVMLLAACSDDPTLTSDPMAVTREAPGVAGKMWMIDLAGPIARFDGALSSSMFVSSTGADTLMALQLPFGATPVPTLLHGARIRYSYAGGSLTGGQIDGAILKTDFDQNVVPQIARNLTTAMMAGGMAAANINSIFDTGGTDDGSGCLTKTNCPGNYPPTGQPACKNPAFGLHAGQCADQCDNVIDTCEVSTCPVLKNVIQPDVQMFQGGVYSPNPANTTKDSISVGVGFTAKPATF